MIVENETGIFIPMNNVKLASDKIFELIQSNNYNKLHTHSIERVQTYFSMKSFENQIGKIVYS
jgi:hypothetical protein